MKNEEIIKKVMKGDSKNKNYQMLKEMFPELFKVIAEDIQKALSLKEQEFSERCREMYSKEWDKIRKEERSCIIKEEAQKVEKLKDKSFIMSILAEDVTMDEEERMKFIDVKGVQDKFDEIFANSGEEDLK
jgi:hypothetical protein